MEDFLKQLVEEDTSEAWQALKDQMPWNCAGADDAAVKALGFKEAEVDVYDPEAVEILIAENEEGTVWAEFDLHPYLTIGEDFAPNIMYCLELSCLTKDSKPTSANAFLISNKARPKGMQDTVISLLIVACPRCQLMFTKGDEDIEFDTNDEGWIREDCAACGGSGEWEYEL